jgi:hypothetical protein
MNRYRKPVVFIIAGLLAAGSALAAAEWSRRYEEDVRYNSSEAVERYPWLEPFVLEVDRNHWLRFRFLRRTTPDMLASQYIDALVEGFEADGSTFSISGLAANVRARNKLWEACRNWPLEHDKPACREVARTPAARRWLDWFGASIFEDDHYLYLKDGRSFFGGKVTATLRLCNLAPYSVQNVLYYEKDVFDGTTEGWFRLQAGECESHTRKFSNVEPGFLVHSAGVDLDEIRWVTDQVNAIIAQDDDPRNDSLKASFLDETRAHWTAAYKCVEVSSMERKTSLAEEVEASCPPGTRPAPFMRPVHGAGEEAGFFLAIEHPNLSLLPNGERPDEATLNASLQSAAKLAESVSRQVFFDANWSTGPPPFLLGAALVDFNGPLNPGIGLTNALPMTIFGVDSPLEDGDVVVSINGDPVFGERDLYQLLVNHGLSRQHGIGVPLTLEIYRQGYDSMLRVQTTYVFNENFREYSGDRQGPAFWYGMTEPIFFGGAEFATCAGSNLLKGFGNLLSAFAQGLCEGMDGEDCGDSELPFEYHDVAECNWQQTQLSALARQKHHQLFSDAQWLGIVSPSGVRLLAGKTLRRRAVRSFGASALTRAVVDAGLESVETALWSLGTAPPGEPLAERLQKAGVDASYGAGMGFVSGIIIHSIKR